MSDLERWAERLNIKDFRGVYMREALPEKCKPIECGIINLGDLDSNGTHWTCYMRKYDEKIYFDSFGDSEPPVELVNYLGAKGLKYNSYGFQNFNDPPICGHLCLEVLRSYFEGNCWDLVEEALLKDKYVWRSWFFKD